MADLVHIVEVGPRDGLQNESSMIATQDKIRLVNLLSECGFSKIEVTSFVSPKWVPQLADAADVMAGIKRNPDVAYTVLTPNIKGYEAAKAAGVNEVAIFASASETFSWKNINCSIAQSLERFAPVVAAAKADGLPVRGYVSCAISCPYDGPVAPAAVVDVAEKMYALGCYEISLGDTIGAGSPVTITAMLSAVLDALPAATLAGHYHDTNGRALDNIAASLELGVRCFDAAIAGLGGCPYARGATGNVATRAVASRLHELGFETGINQPQLAVATAFARSLVQPKSEAGE